VIERRRNWVEATAAIDANKLVFLDESSINIGMTRLYGRGKGKARVVDYVPDVRFQRMSILSTVRLNGAMVPQIFQGSLNGERFEKYVAEELAPTLKKGDIVVLDNLTSHKVKGVTDPIKAVGAGVLYLPPYGLEFNPIELLWSKMKVYLRKVKARSIAVLEDAISAALETITPVDILNWFKHSGYVHV
jgi:transposase